MNPISLMYRCLTILLLSTLVACGGGGDGPAAPPAQPPATPPSPPPPAGTLIGVAGGTVTGPNGAQVVIPAGALTTEVRINIEQITSGAPALPAGFTAYGPMFEFTPHGTTFAVPVTITLPFDPAGVPAGATPVFYKTTNAQTQWEEIANAIFGASSVSATVSSFSDDTVVIPPLKEVGVSREWTFFEYRGDALKEAELLKDETAKDLDETYDFGPADLDEKFLLTAIGIGSVLVPPDHIAVGRVGSYNFGKTYWVGAESPKGNGASTTDPIGSKSQLVQWQSYRKDSADATYEFTLSGVKVEAFDYNGSLARTCPQEHKHAKICDLVGAEVSLDVSAYDISTNNPSTFKIKNFFRLAGGLRVFGSAIGDDPSITYYAQPTTAGESVRPFWDASTGFTIESAEEEAGASLTLAQPVTYGIDLSSVPEKHIFTIKVIAHAFAYDRAAGTVSGKGAEFPTAAHAWLRDPAVIGGATVITHGLTAVETPLPIVEAADEPVEPAPCIPGPGPDLEAGVIQFSDSEYLQTESGFSPIVVSRSGGSRGAVTATFTASDGTAVAAVDYTATNHSVFFADGDAEPRVVSVPIVQDTANSEPDKTVNLKLSQAGGCAALGPQSTAILTIRDDDPRPPLPSGLDTTFGSAGKASLAAFGGDRSAMALQADGKIVMAGGTFTDFVLARFLANGGIDSNFGNAGKVTSNIVSGEQEEALAVAIQPDGKIVVAGYTGQAVGPSVIVLARYLSTGEPDASFGVGGGVVSTVVGRAFAIALDTRGSELKILVAGDDPAAEDMVVARFNSNGTLDTTFNDDGHLTVNVAGAGDIASNIVLLSNGGVLLTGGNSAGLTSTSLAKLDASGSPDPGFGTGGKLVLAGRQVGEGLALQSDGKIVLAGKVETLVPPATQTLFEVMRLNANGTPDSSFGTAGIVDTGLSTRGDATFAVTLQPDGKIVAVGASSIQVNANFAVVRYDAHGELDTTFGGGTGKLTVDFFGSTDVAESVLVQPDGKIVAGGLARDSVDGYGVVRINR